MKTKDDQTLKKGQNYVESWMANLKISFFILVVLKFVKFSMIGPLYFFLPS